MKIFHEAPKSIFNLIQDKTGGDYALVHLFEQDEDYFNLFKNAVAKGREVILDNSVFELETAFDPEKFVFWINELNPTYYIVPDVLEDADATIKNMREWMQIWKPRVKTGSKIIGVVQGKTYEDTVRCYRFMDEIGVDKIAISFDYSWFQQSFPHSNRLVSLAMGRVKLLGDMVRGGIINSKKPHHLLGCAIPGEGIFYNRPEYEFIDSMDTSNPVVHGIYRIEYSGPLGLTSKKSQKLYTLINEEVDLDQWHTIEYNVSEFRRMWRGTYGI